MTIVSPQQIEEPVTETKAVFKSNLFGSLGAGVFVGPNLIDFSTVFDNVAAKILENLPVFVTVILITLMYVPLVIICRKFDKKDERKVGVGQNDLHHFRRIVVYVYS